MEQLDAEQATMTVLQIMNETDKPGTADIVHPDGSRTFLAWGRSFKLRTGENDADS